MLVAHIINNKVINILNSSDLDVFKILEEEQTKFEEYNKELHPWGPNGVCDIEIGVGWRDRLKQKLGYCIFCGDNVV